jgi:hypothetical protein
MKKGYFKYILCPKILWYITGWFIIDQLISYWHLNIAKKDQIWRDASSEDCSKYKYCRFCGKGKA